MKRPLIIANWKLYIESEETARTAAKAIARGASRVKADLVLCPATPFLPTVRAAVSRAGISVGAQAISRYRDHKHTGEVSARAVASTGARYVLVGHSERRAMGQTNEEIAQEIDIAFEAKLLPVLCVGERERDGAGGHYAAIEEQLRASLPKLSRTHASELVIAYEPVWAIGKTAADAMTPDALEETAIYLRRVLADIVGRAQALKIPILYGGSVEPENADYLMKAGVNGFLVGHASVDPKSFLIIAAGAAKAYAPQKH